MGDISWQHILVEGAVYLIPTLGGGYLAYRQLMWTLKEYLPHNHGEDREEADPDTPLTVRGIIYPRHFNGKS